MFVNIFIHKHFLPWLRRKLGHKHRFESIEQEMEEDPTWPPHNSASQRQDDVTSSNGVLNSTLKTVSETEDKFQEGKIHYRKHRTRTRPKTEYRQSALLESNLATLSTNSLNIGHFSMSLPNIEKEVESLKSKEWHQRSYIQEKDCYL